MTWHTAQHCYAATTYRCTIASDMRGTRLSQACHTTRCTATLQPGSSRTRACNIRDDDMHSQLDTYHKPATSGTHCYHVDNRHAYGAGRLLPRCCTDTTSPMRPCIPLKPATPLAAQQPCTLAHPAPAVPLPTSSALQVANRLSNPLATMHSPQACHTTQCTAALHPGSSRTRAAAAAAASQRLASCKQAQQPRLHPYAPLKPAAPLAAQQPCTLAHAHPHSS
jgi:hypothetical protein